MRVFPTYRTMRNLPIIIIKSVRHFFRHREIATPEVPNDESAPIPILFWMLFVSGLVGIAAEIWTN